MRSGTRNGRRINRAAVPSSNSRPPLLKTIGGGSYGEVWLARNVIGTLRALKVVRRATFERVEHVEHEFRGIQKFEPTSRTHEGFVDILQIEQSFSRAEYQAISASRSLSCPDPCFAATASRNRSRSPRWRDFLENFAPLTHPNN
jgi:hypothetical protein